MRVALVTVTFQSEAVLPDFIRSVEDEKNIEIIVYVIDNNSSDKTMRILEKWKKESDKTINIISNNYNIGVASANNQGIEKALRNNCDYILLLNNDIYFSNNTIKCMVQIAEERKERIVVSKILYADTDKIWMAGGKISITGGGHHIGVMKRDLNQYHNRYIQYAPTCFMLIHNSVFKIVGVMDDRYFVYLDDTDFILRARRKKIALYYINDVKVYHKVSYSTGGSDSLFSIYYGNRNRIYYIKKNYFLTVPIRLAIFLLVRIKYIMKYSITQKNALFKGLRDGFKM